MQPTPISSRPLRTKPLSVPGRCAPLRGRLAFVGAADARWIPALMGARIIASCARRSRELELDDPTLTRSNDLLLNALQGGTQRSRTQLLAMLEQNGISTKGQ